jgi:hypothetical protein
LVVGHYGLKRRNELVAQTYRPGAYYSFYIRDPKRRLISAAPFRDRVVHHALCNVIEPLFERTFIGDSYANRVGKGTHRALDRAQELARRYQYVLQCDVEQFFPSVDHTVLRAIISRKIADEQVMWLVDQILNSGAGVLTEEYTMVYFPGDDLFAVNRPRGLPIGNLTRDGLAVSGAVDRGRLQRRADADAQEGRRDVSQAALLPAPEPRPGVAQHGAVWSRRTHGQRGRPTAGGMDEKANRGGESAAVRPRSRGRAAIARVVRGGSWNNNQRNARCAYRDRNVPANFNNNLGLRVVVSLCSEF